MPRSFSAGWPYFLEDGFGGASVNLMGVEGLNEFDDRSCLRVALRLGIPLRHTEGLRIPVDVTASNPVPNSLFSAFRIQTVREAVGKDFCVPYIVGDDPFDESLGSPLFALYGVADDGMLEHIADRQSYSGAVGLAKKIAPGVSFPSEPILGGSTLPSTRR